ncbi:ExsB family transcriptional regulator [Amycolatopsis sp. NPDC004625]|uniref:ExsB family transcriptional regulator n=1 Tax=Amycolatopsis sp. NPDC004625 TaxID=3154670 RepID=UPI0033B28140
MRAGIEDRLLAGVRSLGSVAVAFSGGVDSAVVLAAAVRALPAGRVLAAIADSPSLARAELGAARGIAAGLGVELAEVPGTELAVPGYRDNAGDRCYFCKQSVLTAIGGLAHRRGYAHVATGTHADDHRALHRPGLRAARELRIVEPLAAAGLGKSDVRALAAAWSLPVADKPSAPCLASRISVGVPVSIGRLNLVERAEMAVRARLAEAGIRPRDVRVRLLGTGFRVELDAPAHAAVGAGLAAALVTELGALGLSGQGAIALYRAPALTPPR